MAGDRPDLPPVRLLPEDELARLARAVPLLDHAVRLARLAGPAVPVDAMGDLSEADLRRAAAELGLEDDEDGLIEASRAWSVAVDTGLVELVVTDETEGAGDEPAGRAVPGETLRRITGENPGDVLELWLAALESALVEATAPDLEGLLDTLDEEDAGEALGGWDPEEEGDFLDSALANLYLFSALEEHLGAAVPLPALAASLVVPDDMEDPTDEVLEEVSDVMMCLDEHFRLLEGTGLIVYRPVDEALIGEDRDEAVPEDPESDEFSRYGVVALTPLGVYGVRARLNAAGVHAPAEGDLAAGPATVLLDDLLGYPDRAARAEIEGWLARRRPADAAGELLAAARGDDSDGPGRRLVCQQALSLLGDEAGPALREVLDDRQLGGLARVWLTGRGTTDVPAPDQEMVFWLTIDTFAAQFDTDEDPEPLRELVTDLVARHDGFFAAAWRTDHPDTADVLETMGRLHPDRAIAKEARKAAFKARSRS